ncbi:putative sulfatase [Blastomonas natatoria]|uniref:Putative sulfatase n=2 Tax=Blastomonas natatoria TaxID=34015 RepID=A0A2V3UUB3_9SPHN|nr:putative sulfatase [Blastomonas natatoria]
MKCYRILITLLLATISWPGAQAKGSQDRPPNIIVIMADDLGWGDIGANGAKLIKTPNIDRLAAQGIRLTSFYAGANVCTPSRAALMTGRYPMRSGMQHVVMPHSDYGLPQSEFTIAEMLHEAGYATGMVGKWHLGHRDEFWPTAHGFDEFTGVAYSNDMQPFDLYHHKTVVQSPAEQRELTDRYANAATDFISRHRAKPFFLYYAETFPHLPLAVPDSASGVSEAGLYGDVVEHLDEGIGRILAALQANGIADNTLVILTSDNGPWFEGDAGMFRGRKGGTHEGGFRVPFIARLPGAIAPGQVSQEMAMNIDILPTVAAFAGLKMPTDRTIDGRSLRGVLTKSEPSPHEVLFFFDGNDIAAVRDRRYRLVLSTFYRSFPVAFERFGMPLLFDLDKDPEERFSYLREQPDVAARLMARVGEMRAEVETLHKQAGNPFAPKDPSIPVGPVLSPDVRAHK